MRVARFALVSSALFGCGGDGRTGGDGAETTTAPDSGGAGGGGSGTATGTGGAAAGGAGAAAVAGAGGGGGTGFGGGGASSGGGGSGGGMGGSGGAGGAAGGFGPAPTAIGDFYDALEGSYFGVGSMGGVLSNDEDPNSLGLVAVLDATTANGTLDLAADGGFGYTPSPGFVGQDSFVYHASDGTLDSPPATVTIDVLAAPVAVDDAYQVDENGVLTVGPGTGVLANDAHVLSASSSDPTIAMNADGSFSYTPPLGWSGEYVFAYAAEGALGSTATAEVTVTVVPQPSVPIAFDDVAGTKVGNAITLEPLVNDTDADGDPLTILSVGTAANGTVVDHGDGTVTYTPSASFTGVDWFDYVATDGFGGSDSGRVAVAVDSLASVLPGTASMDAAVASIARLADDSFVVVGHFNMALTLSPGAGEINLAAPGRAVFVAKYDPTGAPVFAKAMPAGSYSGASGIDAASDGSFSIAGYFRGSMTFDPGLPTELVLQAASGLTDMNGFFARFAQDGSLVWASQKGNPTTCAGCEKARGVAARSDGSTVVAGYSRSADHDAYVTALDASGTTSWSDGGPPGDARAFSVDAFADDSVVVSGCADGDLWLRRYSSAGVLVWEKTLAGALSANTPAPAHVRVLADQSFLLTGGALPNAVFGAGEANETALAAGGGFVARYGSDGALSWVEPVLGGNAVSANEVGGDILVVGHGVLLTFAPGSGDPGHFAIDRTFVAKYGPAGERRWELATPLRVDDAYVESSLEVFSDGTVAFGGWVDVDSTFGAGETGQTSVSATGDTPVVVRFLP